MSADGRRTFLRWIRFPEVRPESAQLVAWACLGVVSVITNRVAPRRDLRPALALLRDALIVGQLVAAGLVAYAAVAIWRKYGPKRAIFASIAVGLAALVITGPALREDLGNLATKVPIPYEIARAALTIGVATAVPFAALLGRIVARPWLRGAGVTVAIGLAAANHFVLPDDYPGMHLVAAIAAATLFGAAIASEAAIAGRAGKFVRGALALGAAASVLVRPSNSVAVAVKRVPGDVVAPWLARLREGNEAAIDPRDLGAVLSPVEVEWWRSRIGAPPIPAGKPVLPKNAIVVLVTIDCLRADVLAGVKHKKTLPTLFAMRDAGIELTEARATATATTQSVSSIFTGRYYSQLYWKARPNWNAEAMYPDADPTPRFPELLAKRGVRTVTISGMPGLTKDFGVVKGFQEEKVIPGGRGFAHASQIMPHVLSRLETASLGGEPLFLYVHFTDAHAPYDTALAKGSPFERYMSGLAHIDAELGKLFVKIDADPALKDRVAILLSADHGEAFGEHGSQYHATTIYEELLRVPLLVKIPGAPARRIQKPVTLVDLAPTILDLFGAETPGEMMGESLVPFFRGEDPALTRPIIADSSRLQRAVIFPDGFKIIHDRRRDTIELFDLKRDPKEKHDVFDQSGATGATRLLALKAFFQAHTLKRPGYKVPYGR